MSAIPMITNVMPPMRCDFCQVRSSASAHDVLTPNV